MERGDNSNPNPDESVGLIDYLLSYRRVATIPSLRPYLDKQAQYFSLGLRFPTIAVDIMAEDNSNPITIDELEAIAKQKLLQNVYDYYASGSDDQKCVRRNRKAFDR